MFKFSGFLFRSSYFHVLVMGRENCENLDLARSLNLAGNLTKMVDKRQVDFVQFRYWWDWGTCPLYGICIGKRLGTCTFIRISLQFRESRTGDSTVYHTVNSSGILHLTELWVSKTEQYYHTWCLTFNKHTDMPYCIFW